MNTALGEVALKNGKTAPGAAVATAMLSLRLLLERNPVAFYEMVCLCRDPSHQLWGDSGEKIRALGLMDSTGRPHQITRDVVLSAVVGDDAEMGLGSPYAEPES